MGVVVAVVGVVIIVVVVVVGVIVVEVVVEVVVVVGVGVVVIVTGRTQHRTLGCLLLYPPCWDQTSAICPDLSLSAFMSSSVLFHIYHLSF